MQPDPFVPTADARRASVRRAPRVPVRRARVLSLATALTATLLLLAIAPTSAASEDRSWRAKVGASGANGAVTVVAHTSGTGTATLRLKSLPASTMTTVAIRAGTCAKPGTVAAALTAARSSASGALSATRSLPSSGVTRLRGAPSLVATVRAGSFFRCAPLARLAIPSPSPSPSPSPGTGALDVRAAGFAFTPASLTVDAGLPFSVAFRNDDAGIAHGFSIGASTTSAADFSATIITGKTSETFTVPALSAGTYVFYCPVHRSMTGTLTVRGVGGAATPSPVAPSSAPAPTAPPTTPPAPPTPYPTYPTY